MRIRILTDRTNGTRTRTTQKLTYKFVEICSTPSTTVPLEAMKKKEKSSRYDQVYHLSKENFTCIICAQKKKDKHGKEIHISTMTFRKADEEEHKAEKQLIEFAEIHLAKYTKHTEAANRILLTKSTKSLLLQTLVTTSHATTILDREYGGERQYQMTTTMLW